MSYFSDQLAKRMDDKGFTQYTLAKQAGMTRQVLNWVVNGERRPTDETIRKLASVKKLGLKQDVMLAWRLVDEYDAHVLALACELLYKE